jgi:hypothetical protein
MIRKSVKPGDKKIPADEYNALLRLLRKPQGVPGGTLEEMYPPTICYVRNDTAFSCDAFTVLGLNGPVITRADNDVEFRNSITFKGITPDSDDHEGKYCILQEPIKSGKIGRAVFAGVTWAQLNITAEADEYAEIADGVRSSIKTGATGSAKILYKEAGTGTNKWGLVYLYCCGAEPTGVPFRNDSSGSETVPAYGVMRITGSTDISGTEHVTIAKPNSDFKRKYLVNGATAVPYNETGLGTWLEEADWVLYDDANTPALGESWGPSNDSWKLKKWRYGFTIVGNPTGGATDLVRAWQEEVNEFQGKTDSTHNKGSSGTISIYDGNDADTTDNMASVKNIYANVASGKWVQVRWVAGFWKLVSAECA